MGKDLIPLKEFWQLDRVSLDLKRPLQDALRLKAVRGYKIGNQWYVTPDEVVEDLKFLGGAHGRNAAERKATALEGRLLRDSGRAGARGKEAQGKVFSHARAS